MNNTNIMSSTHVGLLLCVFCLLFINIYAAVCPWSDASLVKWSTIPAWNEEGANVSITADQRILLDLSPGVVLHSVDIYGALIIDNKDLNLDAHWIRVNNGGSFIAGAEDSTCRITKKFVVTFYGNRTTLSEMGKDPYDQTALGSKGIAAASNSTFELHGYSKGPSWTRLAKTAWVNDTTIELEEQVYWTVGDSIVIASTDFGEIKPTSAIPSNWTSVGWYRGYNFPDQTEQVTIKSITGRVITLNAPLTYNHWGSGVQKAEVGLLTRRIKFTGDNSTVDTEFGAHMIIRKCKSVHIEGIEVTRSGQKGVLARYPVHFHFLHDVIGEGIYYKESSSHNNFQRALVVHDSHGLLIKDIVSFNVSGHMYFLEDGGERMNVFDHVLGLVANPVAAEEIKYGIKVQIIPTDNQPAIFWITNPNNTFVNCTAVGGKFGFWFLMPKYPIGAALTAGIYNTSYNPRTVNLNQFHDNVAHSNSDTGYEWDNYLTVNGTTEEASYSPSIRPLYYNLVAYKCRQFGLWGKSSMLYYNLTVMDNRRGLMVNGGTLVADSLFVGESDNIGTPRPGYSRNYPDQNGANNTKICGHESYDNGGPQYSWNNVFVNFVNIPNVRNAGALCPLQTGPFMLDTENRLLNLTFINANEIHVGLPKSGDNEWGWTVLDLDGTTTKIDGGGWIVSNSSHLINPSCIPKPDWGAYACPPHAEGFLQLLITDQTAKAPSPWAINGSNVASTIISNTRVLRGVFIDQKDKTKEGRVLGAIIDCANGTADACYQFMNNVLPRHFYTFRFKLNDYYVRTPSYISVNIHSANPGDYLYVSIPYPPSARPFNVSTSYTAVTPLTEVYSLDDVNSTTYYYDVDDELLYVYLKSTGNGYSTREVFTDYNSGSPSVHIRAACSECNPSQEKVSAVVAPPATPSLVENKYVATLQTCQVLGNSKPSKGLGSAFFWFYPSTKELHYNVYHDLTGSATAVELGTGTFGTSEYVISTRSFNSAASPLRGIFTLSELQWANLVKGNLYVNVLTTSYPNGQIRGQIQFQGTNKNSAVRPPRVSTANPCAPTGKYVSLFTDYPSYLWTDQLSNYGTDYTNRSLTGADVVCGNASLLIGVQKGSYSFNIAYKQNFTLDMSVYSFFEFYVKLLPTFGEVSLYVGIVYNGTTPRYRVLPEYVNNSFIDEYSGWNRVRMPLTAFLNLPGGNFNITRVTFSLADTSAREEFYLDEIRFTENKTESTKDSVASAEVALYDPNICATEAATSASGASSSSSGASGGATSSASGGASSGGASSGGATSSAPQSTSGTSSEGSNEPSGTTSGVPAGTTTGSEEYIASSASAISIIYAVVVIIALVLIF